MFGVPSMYGAIARLKNATPEDFKIDLRADQRRRAAAGGRCARGSSSGSACRCYEGYGLTETSPVVALNMPQEHRPGSVGQAGAGRDGQDRRRRRQRRCRTEQIGEVWLKGPMIMKGYHNLPKKPRPR